MTKEQINEFTLRTTQSNHSGLVLVLFDMEKVYLDDSLEAFADEDIEGYLKNLELAKRVHNELMDCINPKDPLGKKMLSVLRFIYGRFISSYIKKEPQELDRCQNMMYKFREAFSHIHDLDEDEPVMKNAHQVYAGLTYGKGTLNESIQGTDYSNRGFKA